MLCWEQVPGGAEGQGPAGRMGQRRLATCTEGQYVAQGARGRNSGWPGGSRGPWKKREKDFLLQSGMEQPKGDPSLELPLLA